MKARKHGKQNLNQKHPQRSTSKWSKNNNWLNISWSQILNNRHRNSGKNEKKSIGKKKREKQQGENNAKYIRLKYNHCVSKLVDRVVIFFKKKQRSRELLQINRQVSALCQVLLNSNLTVLNVGRTTQLANRPGNSDGVWELLLVSSSRATSSRWDVLWA